MVTTPPGGVPAVGPGLLTPNHDANEVNPLSDPDPRILAKLVGSKFIERRDVKAVQTGTGAYMPVTDGMDGSWKPWTFPDILDHLSGAATYGHYIVSAENTCRLFAFDLDIRKDFLDVWAGPKNTERHDLELQLYTLAYGLAQKIHWLHSLTPVVTYSGHKGLHVYGLLDPGTPAAEARELGIMTLESFEVFELERGKNFFRHKFAFPALSIEIFPKQETVREGDGLGNLMRLPLGVNRKTGGKGFTVQMDARANSIELDDPIQALTDGSLR